MYPYVLSCCTTVDTNRAWVDARNLAVVPFHFQIGETLYTDDFWTGMQPEEMYARMLAGEDSKTSQISVGDYTAHFKKYLEEGRDILHVTLSSGISGTINSALVAAQDLREEYPEQKIYVVDSFAASSGFGLLMDRLCTMRDEGMSIDALKEYAESHRLRVNH